MVSILSNLMKKSTSTSRINYLLLLTFIGGGGRGMRVVRKMEVAFADLFKYNQKSTTYELNRYFCI